MKLLKTHFLALVLCTLGAHAVQAATTYTVTTTADNGDDSTPTVGSLRAAIKSANAAPGTIGFSIAGTGVHTISPPVALPDLAADGIIIDGATQPGFTAGGAPQIRLDGTSAGDGVVGLTITAGSCAVRMLNIANFGANGIRIVGSGATHNRVEGCYIGLDATGAVANGNGAHAGSAVDGGSGVVIHSGAQFNDIGNGGNGATTLRNVISGNGTGVYISAWDGDTANNTVCGNYIGVNAAGTAGVTDGAGGVALDWRTHDNKIGSPGAGNGNVLSGQSGGYGTCGLSIGNYSHDNAAYNNLIGTDATGTYSITNQHGVSLSFGCTNNSIGGANPGERNVISGNYDTGVRIAAFANSCQVIGNYIGTDITGMTAIPNGSGIAMDEEANDITIGGTIAGAGNVISGNYAGIYMGVTDHVAIQGNLIGIAADGVSSLGNNTEGIWLVAGASTTIGGTAAGAGNRIAYNGTTGITVLNRGTAPTTGNTIRGNSIFSNNGLGIDLGATDPDGSTPNDTGDGDTGGNGLQNFPAILQASATNGTTNIYGSINSTPNTSFILDFYTSTTTDGTGYGEGEAWSGSSDTSGNHNVTTDSDGDAFFACQLPGDYTGQFVTATLTSAVTGDTSEFSFGVQIVDGIPLQPTVSIAHPLHNQQYNDQVLGAINGLVTDNSAAQGGIAKLVVYLYRRNMADTGYEYWTGSDWTTFATSTKAAQGGAALATSIAGDTATGATWTCTTPLPGGLLDSGTYSIYAQAFDKTGGASTPVWRIFQVHSGPPSISIQTPGDREVLTDTPLTAITGAVTDYSPRHSGIKQILLYLYRRNAADTGYEYWTGSSWTTFAISPLAKAGGGALATSISGAPATGATWSCTTTLPAGLLENGVYFVRAEAIDNKGEASDPVWHKFTVRRGLPTVTIAHPLQKQSVTTGALQIDGTVTDNSPGHDGIRGVLLFLYRRNGAGTGYEYWNGSAWTTYATSKQATTAGAARAVNIAGNTTTGATWSCDVGALPNVATSGTYYVRAQAVDSRGMASEEEYRVFTINSPAGGASASVGGELSSATANATAATVTLNFSTALDSASAADPMRYVVAVNGQQHEVHSVAISGARVVLMLPAGALTAGDSAVVIWDNLLDTQGRSLGGCTPSLTAR